MNKNIAIVCGGFTGEAEISYKSASNILSTLRAAPYHFYLVKITQARWECEIEGKSYVVNKDDFSIDLNDSRIKFDGVFNAIHGKPGETGALAGYFDMLNIPYTSSGVTASSLTASKSWCNAFLREQGIQTPSSVLFYKEEDNSQLFQKVKYPCFVKPNNGGSSVATFKVNTKEELDSALSEAFNHDSEVIVEQFVGGREVTCGIINVDGTTKPLPVTEIIPKSEFFDYKEKYTEDGADEITPANISEEIKTYVQNTSKKVFDLLKLRNTARIDYIFNESDIFLIEVNTIPGMSERSILPQQIEAAGLTALDVYTAMIEKLFSTEKQFA